MRILLLIFLFSFHLSTAQTVVIAHRGASAYAPENTIESFLLAAKMGADYVELDIHQTKDSVLVVMHDRCIDRTTNLKGAIKDLTYAEIQKANANVSGKFKQYGYVKVPTLKEVLDTLKSFKIKVLIELKRNDNYYVGIENRLMALLNTYPGYEDHYIIHSFNKNSLLDNSIQNTTITKQKLLVMRLPLFVSLTFDKKITFDNFSKWNGANIYYKFCRKRIIRKLHKLNKTTFAWTVNKPKSIKRLVKSGVDGIITNKPDVAKNIILKNIK